MGQPSKSIPGEPIRNGADYVTWLTATLDALRLERVRNAGKDGASPLPVTGALHLLDGSEIDRVDDDRRGVEPAEPGRRLAVEDGVIVGGRFPAHAADEADGFHGSQMARKACPRNTYPRVSSPQ